MDGLDVERFISSQKAKLQDEKSRLEDNRKMRGILPSDSIIVERNDKLRRERQSDYQDHMLKRRRDYHPQQEQHDKFPAPIKKSIEDIRHDMSHDRNREISYNQEEINMRKPPLLPPQGDNDYSSLKERKITEERKYRGEVYNQPDPSRRRRQWRDEDEDGHNHYTKVRFEGESSNKRENDDDRYYSSWDKEENDLVQWTRNQAHLPGKDSTQRGRRRAQTPPTYDSPREDVNNHSKSTVRSISAPSVTGLGIAGLIGREENVSAKRLKQRKYAEELRSQMKEKHGSKQRETAWMKSDGPSGTHNSTERNRDIGHDAHKYRSNDADYQPSHHRPRDENRAPNNQYRDEGDDRKIFRQPQKHPSQAKFEDRRDYYRDPYHLPPPPLPPRFNDYGPPHGESWRPAYYPHYQGRIEDDPYAAERYHPHYGDSRYPVARGDPYIPPANGPHRPRVLYDGDKNYSRHPVYQHHEEERYNHCSPPPLHQSNKEPKLSPLHGGRRNLESKTNKTAYRAELEIQMKEKKERESKEKMAKVKYESKLETEIYDPFGKGGCGAPVRDQHGNLVADLRKMRHINENRLSNTSPRVGASSIEQPKESGESPTMNKSLETKLTYDKFDGEDVKKATQNSYRDFLQKQVKEREFVKQQEKQRKKHEEEKELEQLEKDRKRMKEEYQKEIERQRKKEEDARNKNKAIKEQAEMKRQMEIMKLEQKEAQQMEKRSEHSLHAQGFPQQRPQSPPIPTLRNKRTHHYQGSDPPPLVVPTPSISSPPSPDLDYTAYQQQRSFAPSSPPVPALRKKRQVTERNPLPHDSQQREDADKDQSGTISDQSKLLTQLGAIRMHLQQELAKQTQKSEMFQVPRKQQLQQQKPQIKVTRPRVSALNGMEEHNHLEMFDTLPNPSRPERTLDIQQESLARREDDMLLGNQGQRRRWDSIASLSPPSLNMQSRASITSMEVNNMTAKNEERLKRLEAILNAGSNQSSHSQRMLENGNGNEFVDSGQPANLLSVRTAMPNRRLVSRQSEKSMDCEVQHLAVP